MSAPRGYVKKTNFSLATTEMLKILVATSEPGSEAGERARAELRERKVRI